MRMQREGCMIRQKHVIGFFKKLIKYNGMSICCQKTYFRPYNICINFFILLMAQISIFTLLKIKFYFNFNLQSYNVLTLQSYKLTLFLGFNCNLFFFPLPTKKFFSHCVSSSLQSYTKANTLCSESNLALRNSELKTKILFLSGHFMFPSVM